MTTIKNLAFKGGGVLGIAYAGAIKVLEQKNIIQNVEKVAGTSAGSITAALICLNYSADEIQTMVNSTGFASFEDHKDPLRIATKYGMYRGEALLNWVQKCFTDKGLSASATFADLKNAGYRDLHVFATDLNMQGLKEFSYEQTPDTCVPEAIRASMSIPMFFAASKFTNSIPDDHIYVDGGVLYNYPITIFDNGDIPNQETMGFYLTNLGAKPTNNGLGYDELLDYVKILFETLLDAQNDDFKLSPEDVSRTVMIDNLGISSTNFNLTAQQETDLYNSGVKYTTEYLNRLGIS